MKNVLIFISIKSDLCFTLPQHTCMQCRIAMNHISTEPDLLIYQAQFRPKMVKETSILTHWVRVTHICVSNLTIIGSGYGLSPGRRQAIICTNAGILLIWTLGANFSEILSEINTFSFRKMHLKLSSGKWRPSCLGLNVLTTHTRSRSTGQRWNRVTASEHQWIWESGETLIEKLQLNVAIWDPFY